MTTPVVFDLTLRPHQSCVTVFRLGLIGTLRETDVADRQLEGTVELGTATFPLSATNQGEIAAAQIALDEGSDPKNKSGRWIFEDGSTARVSAVRE